MADNDGDGFSSCAGDCDDADSSNTPGGTELCDFQDNDCDGLVDEGYDLDGDGVTSCGADCNDQNASVYPGAPELCDGLDGDCDGLAATIDTPPTPSYSTTGTDRIRGSYWTATAPTTIANIEAFIDGPTGATLGWQIWSAPSDAGPWTFRAGRTGSITQPSGTSAWQASPAFDYEMTPGLTYATVVNWTTPNVTYWYGFANGGATSASFGTYGGGIIGTAGSTFSSTTNDYAVRVITAEEIDADGDGVLACGLDCDDSNATVFGGAPELCDTLDNDCDGALSPDETDADNDGFLECINDCDDTDPLLFPGQTETCDGADQDCDGNIDEDFDVDGDGFFTDTVVACLATYAGNTDCDDAVVFIYYGATVV